MKNPNGMAFDGANIWVSEPRPTTTVTKLRASDGANLGTLNCGLREYPDGRGL